MSDTGTSTSTIDSDSHSSNNNNNSDAGMGMGNVDFCDVTQLPGYSEASAGQILRFRDASYMLPMSWRWLPLGDDFVDTFVSRDTDSCIFEREVSAVNEWLGETTLFHVMRGK